MVSAGFGRPVRRRYESMKDQSSGQPAVAKGPPGCHGTGTRAGCSGLFAQALGFYLHQVRAGQMQLDLAIQTVHPLHRDERDFALPFTHRSVKLAFQHKRLKRAQGVVERETITVALRRASCGKREALELTDLIRETDYGPVRRLPSARRGADRTNSTVSRVPTSARKVRRS